MTGARQLVGEILDGSGDSGQVANRLLTELQRGAAVEELRPLLSSGDPAVVAIGVWVASELAAAAAPLAGTLRDLLRHPDKGVRFFAIDAAGSTTIGDEIPAMVADPEPAVRWKAASFLATAPVEQIRAIRDEALDRLLTADAPTITSALNSADARTRWFAAVAAARRVAQDPGPLTAATRTPDPEIREFAEDVLTRAGSVEDE